MTTTYRAFEVTGSRKFRLVNGVAHRGSLLKPDPQETSTALAPVRDGFVPAAHLLCVAAALPLEATVPAQDEPAPVRGRGDGSRFAVTPGWRR
jgi:hypothetical protein